MLFIICFYKKLFNLFFGENWELFWTVSFRFRLEKMNVSGEFAPSRQFLINLSMEYLVHNEEPLFLDNSQLIYTFLVFLDFVIRLPYTLDSTIFDKNYVSSYTCLDFIVIRVLGKRGYFEYLPFTRTLFLITLLTNY